MNSALIFVHTIGKLVRESPTTHSHTNTHAQARYVASEASPPARSGPALAPAAVTPAHPSRGLEIVYQKTSPGPGRDASSSSLTSGPEMSGTGPAAGGGAGAGSDLRTEGGAAGGVVLRAFDAHTGKYGPAPPRL